MEFQFLSICATFKLGLLLILGHPAACILYCYMGRRNLVFLCWLFVAAFMFDYLSRAVVQIASLDLRRLCACLRTCSCSVAVWVVYLIHGCMLASSQQLHFANSLLPSFVGFSWFSTPSMPSSFCWGSGYDSDSLVCSTAKHNQLECCT